jgi:uncharacterized protein (DUF58 family)
VTLRRFLRSLPRPTQLGFSLIQFAVVLTVASSLLDSDVLYLTAAITVSLVVYCFVRCAINLRKLEVTRLVPFPLYSGSRFSSTVVLRNPRRLLSACLVCVHDYVTGAGSPRRPLFSAAALVPPGRRVRTVQHGTFYRRGYKEFERVELESTFPLGLFRSVRTLRLPETVIVYPRLRRLSLHHLSDRLRPAWERPVAARAIHGVDEFAGLREFRPGDNPKWIHWKSAARADRKLLMKELELSALRRVRVVLDTSVPARVMVRGLMFERAVEFAASLARELSANHYVTFVHIRGKEEKTFKVNPHDRTLFPLLHELALVQPVRSGEQEDVPAGMPVFHLQPARFEPNRPWEKAVVIRHERPLW